MAIRDGTFPKFRNHKKILQAIIDKGPDYFPRAIDTMDLRPDRAGARECLYKSFRSWKDWNQYHMDNFFRDHMFISLANNDTYAQYRRLVSPMKAITQNLGDLRFPRILPEKRPVVLG